MIVPKDEIKYIFNPSNLLKGDILLMNTYDERLREKMRCRYEHAAVYIGDAYIMEANGAHVVMSHIYSYAFREIEHACVLRLKKAAPYTLENIARKAREQMGRGYIDTRKFLHVRTHKKSDKKDDTNLSFCSRLVAQCYKAAGIDIVPNADYCEPDDFLSSDILEEVKNGICPFTEDMTTVVMNQQKYREDHDIDSPNAELFEKLSELYDCNIQDLGQALMPSQTRPELNDKAIEIIQTSRMFKHLDDVKRETPWVLDDNHFLEYYSEDIEKALHFIYSGMNHYDNTIIPNYRELHLQMLILANNYPSNSLYGFMKDHITKMVDEAISYRERLTDLFLLLAKERSSETLEFIDRYGLYSGLFYKPKTIDIGFIINDIMKAYYPNIT